MMSLERQPEVTHPLPRTPRSSFAIIALLAAVSQLVSGCVAPSIPRTTSAAPTRPVPEAPTVVLRGSAVEANPTDRECADYHRQRAWERERQVRVLTLELELYRDELARLEREGADGERLEQARREIYWRVGAMGLLLEDPFSERSDIAGF